MKFEIPNNKSQTLVIGGHEIELEFHDKSHPVFDSKGDDFTWGFWDVNKLKIFIRDDLSFSFFLSTLLHELFHVFEDLYGIKISHKDLNYVADLYSQVLLSNFKAEKKSTKRDKNVEEK